MSNVYSASGIVDQIVNYSWNNGSGGSSTAIFCVMGSLFIYIIRNRKMLLLPFVFIAVAGLSSSAVMLISQDGHRAGLICGSLVAAWLPWLDMTFRRKENDVFVEPPAEKSRIRNSDSIT